MTTGRGEDGGDRDRPALVIDPAAYAAAHPGSGALAALRGAAVAAGPGGEGLRRGDTVRVRLPDGDLGSLPVVAAVPAGR